MKRTGGGSAERKVNAVAARVLLDVKPTREESELLAGRINTVVSRLKLIVPRDVEVVVTGSSARDTNMRGDSDVDIFMLFKRSVSKAEMESRALSYTKRLVRGHRGESYETKYAEHPYARLLLSNLNLRVDLVPAYKITDARERATSVDRTQLHTLFISSRLSGAQRDEVRVLKAFMRAHNVYGAEARTEGFSGYLAELFIHHFGSFYNVLSTMAEQRMPLVIDPAGHLGPDDAASAPERFGRELVVIDPTDPGRNVAANVSRKSLARLVLSARAFLKSPSKASFYGAGHSEERAAAALSALRKRLGLGIYAIRFVLPDISEEITWQQLARFRARCVGELEKRGFAVTLSLQEIEGREGLIGIILNEIKIGHSVLRGPSSFMGRAADEFARAHSGAAFIFLLEDRLYAVEQSTERDPGEVLRALSNSRRALPTYLKRPTIYHNTIPESRAKLLYRAYCRETSI